MSTRLLGDEVWFVITSKVPGLLKGRCFKTSASRGFI